MSPNTSVDQTCAKLNECLSTQINPILVELAERTRMSVEEVDRIRTDVSTSQVAELKALYQDYEAVIYQTTTRINEHLGDLFEEGNFVMNNFIASQLHRILRGPNALALRLRLYVNGSHGSDRITKTLEENPPIDNYTPNELATSISTISSIIKKALEHERIPQNISIVNQTQDLPIRIKHRHLLTKDAIFELIHNAINAMPNGGTIIISAVEQGDTVKLTIEDNGKGISEDDLPHVTELNFTRTKGGTGKGLFLIREYFEEILAGRFEIKSTEGQGTTVSITLPIDD